MSGNKLMILLGLFMMLTIIGMLLYGFLSYL